MHLRRVGGVRNARVGARVRELVASAPLGPADSLEDSEYARSRIGSGVSGPNPFGMELSGSRR
eukprot:4519584-Alexandrium_andersonii.AAC.1